MAAAGMALAVVASSAAGQVQEQVGVRRAQRLHVVPYREPGSQPARAPRGSAVAQCATPLLSYFGGPVMSNARVVPVFWNSAVNSSTKANMAQFYSDVTNSAYYDLLSEYASAGLTPVGGAGGTDQSIGRGSATAGIVLTPSVCGASVTGICSLTDAQLQAEIAAQITKGVLPKPQTDSTGNMDTIYMVHFPANISLTLGGVASCTSGGFCAYHNTGTFQSQPLLYGAMMDTFAGQCAIGCGNSASGLDNQTSTASHELGEAVTDADVGLDFSNLYADPAAWGDNNNNCGEIGDICDDGSQDSITVAGRTWGVQELWSNRLNACTSKGTPPTIAVTAPANVSVGSAMNFTVTVKNPGGKTTNTSFVGTVGFSSSDAKANLPAAFAFVPADLGTQPFSVTFNTAGTQTITATDGVNAAITGKATVTVTSGTKTTPVLTWTTPAAVVYGTALSATQLNAKATAGGSAVPGSFAYNPALGTVLTAGTHTLSATFTPTNTSAYTTATASIVLTVTRATPVISWATPAAIVYGTALSATQLGAKSAVAGKFVYSPAAGTVLTAGTHTLSVTFTPTDGVDYTTATRSVVITVGKATPKITWATPVAIVYGTALSATQLSAKSTVAGKLVYSPATGSVLTAGTQTLSVTLTPTDATDYSAQTAKVSLVVAKAAPKVTVTPWATSIKAGSSGSVTVAAARVGSGAAPSGTVSVFWNSVQVGTASVNASGVATITVTAPKTTGASTLYATYAGNGSYLAEKSAVVTVTLTP